MAIDRKALSRQYKETSRPMGVCRVLNKISGESLVTRSVNLPAMLNRHQAQLRFGAHPDRGFQKDWNAHGPDAFAFEVLDTLTPPDGPDVDPSDDLRALEELWIEKLAPLARRTV